MLASNVPAFTVFRHCRGDWLMGFGAAVYHGIAAVEIRTVAEMVKVPGNEDLLWRVRVLDAAYGQAINRKNNSGKRK